MKKCRKCKHSSYGNYNNDLYCKKEIILKCFCKYFEYQDRWKEFAELFEDSTRKE
jgi:hypothetical protein